MHLYHSCLLTQGLLPSTRPQTCTQRRGAGYTLTSKHFLKGLQQTLISDQAKVDPIWTVIHKIYIINQKCSSLGSWLFILDSTSKDQVSINKSDGLI